MRAHTRALFLAACVALFASGAHARALLDADAVPGPAAVVCTSCKDLVAQGEAFVNDPANLEKVEVEVKKICADKGDEAPMCEKLFEDALDYALDVMNTRLTPDSACASAGLCPELPPAPGPDALPPLELTPEFARLIAAEASEAPAPDPSADCLKCKFGVAALYQAVTSNATVTAAEVKADEACAKYGAALDLVKTCQAAVATYAPKLIAQATDFLADADKVCAELHMCPPGPDAAKAEEAPAPKREAFASPFKRVGAQVLKRIGFIGAVRGGVYQ